MLIGLYTSSVECQHQMGNCAECTLITEKRASECSDGTSAYPNLMGASFAEASSESYISSSAPSIANSTTNSPSGVCFPGTTFYTCCKCGDGPKVYEHQNKCVICNHEICGACSGWKW